MAPASPELACDFALPDESTGDVPLDLDGDMIGMTVVIGCAVPAADSTTTTGRAAGRWCSAARA